jgi:hypothetical protein
LPALEPMRPSPNDALSLDGADPIDTTIRQIAGSG